MTAAAARPYWRRVLVPGVLTLVGLAILISLGVWQLQRKAWKEALIATLDAQIKAPPVPLPPASEWPSLTAANSEFRRVRLRVEPMAQAAPAYLYTGASALRTDVKQPGYFVFAPFRLPDGTAVVINRGYIPEGSKIGAQSGADEITGYIRWPETPGLFVAKHDAKDDIWFVRDPAAMAKARGWGSVAPFYIDQEAPVPPGGFPKPGPLTVRLKNDHLGYAITWFGLAGTLVGVFAVWGLRERYNRTP
ncbi:SURF1 family protein [Pseudorhodoplanes sp.]|uniref:SURF1 family protein n=1 Tax=Pseudorhodoplanes sp. TaxID=1934341 RepID=UPI00391AFBA8